MVVTERRASEDPRVLRTRKLIAESFFGLLQENDFSSVTVQQIAARATVNRATFYAHFDDKFDLVRKSIARDFGGLLADRVPAGSKFDRETLELIDGAVGEFINQVFGHCHLDQQLTSTVEASTHETLRMHVKELLRVAGNRVDPDSMEVVSFTISSVLIGNHLAGLTRSIRKDSGIPSIRAVDLLADGLFRTVDLAQK